MRARQAHRRELIQTLQGLRDRVHAGEPGCSCEVFEDLAEPNRFLWTEWWSSPGEVMAAMESERFRTLLGAVQVLGSLESVRRVEQSEDDAEAENGRQTVSVEPEAAV